MSPIVASYIGFAVAALILGWGIVEVYRRYWRNKKVNPQRMDSWVLFKPTSAESIEDSVSGADSGDQEKNAQLQLRAQQNGHYSESKKSL